MYGAAGRLTVAGSDSSRFLFDGGAPGQSGRNVLALAFVTPQRKVGGDYLQPRSRVLPASCKR